MNKVINKNNSSLLFSLSAVLSFFYLFFLIFLLHEILFIGLYLLLGLFLLIIFLFFRNRIFFSAFLSFFYMLTTIYFLYIVFVPVGRGDMLAHVGNSEATPLIIIGLTSFLLILPILFYATSVSLLDLSNLEKRIKGKAKSLVKYLVIMIYATIVTLTYLR